MIRMAKGLENGLLAIALYITVISRYVKSGRGLRHDKRMNRNGKTERPAIVLLFSIYPYKTSKVQ